MATSPSDQLFELGLFFDAAGDDGGLLRLCLGNQGLHQTCGVTVVLKLRDEAFVEFESFRREFAQCFDAGDRGSEVVDHDADSSVSQSVECRNTF